MMGIAEVPDFDLTKATKSPGQSGSTDSLRERNKGALTRRIKHCIGSCRSESAVQWYSQKLKEIRPKARPEGTGNTTPNEEVPMELDGISTVEWKEITQRSITNCTEGGKELGGVMNYQKIHKQHSTVQAEHHVNNNKNASDSGSSPDTVLVQRNLGQSREGQEIVTQDGFWLHSSKKISPPL